MGVSQKGTHCETCKQDLVACVGHFGYLDLALPVFHVGHFRTTITILQSVCKNCSRVMLKPEDAKNFSKKLTNPNLSYLAKKLIHHQVLKAAKKNTKCQHCDCLNGTVKKGGLMKIVHEKLKGKKKTDPLVTAALDELLSAAGNNKELASMLTPSALQEELNPIEVMKIFKNIPKAEIPLLGMTSVDADPSDLIVTRVYVPPPCIRPSVMSEIKSGT